jgi:anthranilate phosphoribosyltransferase
MVRDLPALIKHVGRGARLAKDLPRDEAEQVMAAILSGEADPVQIGGFLIAMRMKSESADELAGFVDAMRAAARPLDAPADPARPLVDVDLHGDGREGRPSLLLPAACLAAAATGARVVLRAWFDSRFARHDLAETFTRLDVPPRAGPAVARRALADAGVAILGLGDTLPPAADLLALRERLGVRTCVNTAVKLLDPAGARRQLVGIFHGPYHAPVAGALAKLGAVRAAVVQAPGGVPERAPDRPVRVSFVEGAAFAEPTPLEGADSPLPIAPAAPPRVDTAAELAALIDQVLTSPVAAPPGAVRMTILTADLILWAAGLTVACDRPDTLARLKAALVDGRAARTLAVMRVCYASS